MFVVIGCQLVAERRCEMLSRSKAEGAPQLKTNAFVFCSMLNFGIGMILKRVTNPLERINDAFGEFTSNATMIDMESPVTSCASR